MTPEFTRNHFELFGLPVAYAVDPAALERAYRDLQGRVHPDRFASASEAERRVAMQWATRANEAYRTLRNPIDRARYLLALKGFDTGEESNTSMPPDFLMQQMEWRESVEDGRARHDAAALEGAAPRDRRVARRDARVPRPRAGRGPQLRRRLLAGAQAPVPRQDRGRDRRCARGDRRRRAGPPPRRIPKGNA